MRERELEEEDRRNPGSMVSLVVIVPGCWGFAPLPLGSFVKLIGCCLPEIVPNRAHQCGYWEFAGFFRQ